ncbi:Calx-beta domain-containing protein [Paludisphaera soli]|uniref:Calx-beta domain-containing protein n=1 Tax=Paludisphaera soli TaxID=2712865 RepID=UPI0013ECB731|nr:Calx-beta domain-containing protein [Paludisphaera soli]
MADASQIAFPGLVIPSVIESAGSVPLTVVRTGDLSGPASVRVRTESTSAFAGFDYAPVDVVVDFAPGESQATFSVPILDDDVSEPLSKFILVRLSEPTGVDGLGFWSVVGFQLEDDEPGSYSSLAFMDFDEAGLWTYNDAEGYRKINDRSPEAIVTTPDRGAYMDFGTAGLWAWDALQGYRKLSDSDPESLALLPTKHAPTPQFGPEAGPIWDGPKLLVDFGQGGLWALGQDAGDWRKVNDVSPENMVADGYGVLLDYGPQGVWRWDSFQGGWTKLNDASPEAMVGGDGGLPVFFDYGASGLWSLQGGEWRRVNEADPEAIIGSRGLLYVDLGTEGLWMVDGIGRWERLSEVDPRSITASEAGVFVDFGYAGFWRYVPSMTRWDHLNARSPELVEVDASSDGVVLDFGDAGVWRWDGLRGYRKLNDRSASRIALASA